MGRNVNFKHCWEGIQYYKIKIYIPKIWSRSQNFKCIILSKTRNVSNTFIKNPTNSAWVMDSDDRRRHQGYVNTGNTIDSKGKLVRFHVLQPGAWVHSRTAKLNRFFCDTSEGKGEGKQVRRKYSCLPPPLGKRKLVNLYNTWIQEKDEMNSGTKCHILSSSLFGPC